MSFMRQALADSVLNETQSWSGRAHSGGPPPPNPPPTSSLIFFYFCRFFLPCVLLLIQQLVRADSFQIAFLLNRYSSFALHVVPLIPKGGQEVIFCSRSCSVLFTAVACQPTEDQVCLLFPGLFFRKRKMPETKGKKKRRRFFSSSVYGPHRWSQWGPRHPR